MDVVSADELQALLEAKREPCVSLFMPTHRVWSETSQDPIRLKNLARDAEAQLTQRGVRRPDARDLLSPAYALENTDSFWRTQSDGLALFISPESFVSYRLPLDFEERVVVGERFHVRPLLPLFAGDGRFYVLVLSSSQVRLLAGTQYSVSELDLKDIPTSLAEALRFDVFEKQQQFHSGAAPTHKGGGRAAIFHGQGVAGDDANIRKRIIEFLRSVDNGVRDALAQEQAPLVLAGLDHLRGLYRSVNHYTYLAAEGVSVNPDDLDREELHRRAWAIVEPQFRKEREEAVVAFEHLSNSERQRVSSRLEEIAPAAYFKRVKVLFVRDDLHRWGTFEPEDQQAHLHDQYQAGDYDMLDFTVTHTLRNGGTVYLQDAETMPASDGAAAIFRF